MEMLGVFLHSSSVKTEEKTKHKISVKQDIPFSLYFSIFLRASQSPPLKSVVKIP